MEKHQWGNETGNTEVIFKAFDLLSIFLVTIVCLFFLLVLLSPTEAFSSISSSNDHDNLQNATTIMSMNISNIASNTNSLIQNMGSKCNLNSKKDNKGT